MYGVEYTPELKAESTVDDDSRGPNGHHRHHGSVQSFGWKESLGAIREVAAALRETTPDNGRVRIGVFAYCQSMLVFPYVKSAEEETAADGTEEDADEAPRMEIGVSIVSDVEEDPFCPLPLNAWTYDIADNDMDWIRFCHVMDSLTEVMEMLTSDCERNAGTWVKNCGGAAMAALVDALKDSGGR